VDAVSETAAALAVGHNETVLDDPAVFAVFYDQTLPRIYGYPDC
jgi:hypothetical protein